jgi:hypothetical protein
MKLLCSILLSCLVAGCATKKEARFLRPIEVPRAGVAVSDVSKVRTPETVKAYPVGRYVDPNVPDQMHERHTIYRRERSAQWNYRASQPYALPLGPVVATSTPSASHFVKANAEQINAQQKAYAESLLEQNIELKEAHRRPPAEGFHHSRSPNRNRTAKERKRIPPPAAITTGWREARCVRRGAGRLFADGHSGFHRPR